MGSSEHNFSELRQEQGAEAGTCSSTQRVDHLEPLHRIASLGLRADFFLDALSAKYSKAKWLY